MEWIDAEKELPEIGEEVLVLMKWDDNVDDGYHYLNRA